MESGEVMALVWKWGRRGGVFCRGWGGGGLELRHLGDLIWVLLKFILLNQRHDEHIVMLAHTVPAPTHGKRTRVLRHIAKKTFVSRT